MDRTGEGEADAVVEPVRLAQIRRDLARSSKISPDPVRSHQIWNLYVAVRDLEVQIGRCGGADRTVAVEIDMICGDGDQRCGSGDRTTPTVEIQGFFL